MDERVEGSRPALLQFLRAREAARHVAPETETRVLNSLGEVYARLGDWAAAERTFKEGIEIFHGAGPYCGESAMLHNLGAMLEKHGRAAEALTTYLGAINVLEECRWHDGDLSL